MCGLVVSVETSLILIVAAPRVSHVLHHATEDRLLTHHLIAVMICAPLITEMLFPVSSSPSFVVLSDLTAKKGRVSDPRDLLSACFAVL